MTKALIVDGNNILARAAFAAKAGRTQMSVDGVNTSALLLFINMLSKYVRRIDPTHLVVCWDSGHALRDAISADYKANRGKPVDDMEADEEEAVTPWQQAKEFLTWAGIAHLSHRGAEADDLIAVLARNTTGEVVILSGDKDLLQLVNGVTTQIRPPDDRPWDTDRVAEELHLMPRHIPLYMSLTGDTSDNISGVRGLGPKKAVALLEKVGWEWEPLLAELGPEKARDALRSRRLVDLIDPEFAAWSEDLMLATGGLTPNVFVPTAPSGMLWEPLLGFLKKWQMNSVLQRLEEGSLWHPGASESSAEATTAAFSGFNT